MIVNYFRYIVSTRISIFYIILIDYFYKGVIIFKMFIKPRKYFPILILVSLQKRVKPDNISPSIFNNIFAYFMIHIYIIINSIVSYIIAPIVMMSIGF